MEIYLSKVTQHRQIATLFSSTYTCLMNCGTQDPALHEKEPPHKSVTNAENTPFAYPTPHPIKAPKASSTSNMPQSLEAIPLK
jgi:hypothetical protein